MTTCPYCYNDIDPNWSYCRFCNHPLIVNLQNRLEGYRAISPNKASYDQEEIMEESYFYDNESDELNYKIKNINDQIHIKETIGENVEILLLEKASLYYQKRDLTSALKTLELALSSSSEQHNQKINAIVHNEMGIIQEDLGYFDSAIYHFQNSIEILEHTEDNSKLIQVYNNIANIYYILKDVEQALKYYNKAADIAAKEGYIIEGIKTSNNKVECLILIEEFDEAKQILKFNLNFFKQEEDIYGIILTLNKFGKVYYHQGSNFYEQAFQSLTEAYDLISKIGDKISIFITSQMEWECCLFLGRLHMLWNDDNKAEIYLLKSLEAVRIFEFDENIKEANIIESLAQLYEIRGENEKAIEYYELAGEIYLKYGDDYKIADIYSSIAHIYLVILDDEDNALDYYNKALESYKALNYSKETADILHKLGDVYANKNIIDLALNYFQDCLIIYKEIFDAINVDLVTEKIRSIKES